MAAAERVPRAPAAARELSREGASDATGCELTLRVIGALDGRAIPGARVQVWDGPAPLLAHTDADGGCGLSLADAPEPVRVRVEAAGHLPQQTSAARCGSLVLELVPTVALSGRVLAADTGAPVAGARLSLPPEDCDDCEPLVALSDAEGHYELAAVPRGEETSLVVEAEGFPTTELEFQLATDAPRVEQDIRLVRGRVLRGRVEDWTSGAGIAGARVCGAVADEQGRFEARLRVDPGTARARVEVTAEGYASLSALADVDAASEPVYRLPGLAFVEGTVRDAEGRPMAGAAVTTRYRSPLDVEFAQARRSALAERPAGWSFEVDPSSTRTDASGAFRLPLVPWSADLELASYTHGPCAGAAPLAAVGPPGSSQRVELRLAPRVAEGTRVAGQVWLNGATSDSLQGTVTWRGPTGQGEARFVRSFRLEVEPGEIALAFTLDGVSAPLEGAAFRVRARAGEEVGRDAALRAPAATLTGHVRFADGAPVARAEVAATCLARAQSWLYFHAFTDELGRYEMPVPDLGQAFSLTAEAHQQYENRVGLRAGTGEVDFVLPRRYPLLLRCLERASGAALEPSRYVRLLARAPGEDFRPVEAESSTPDLEGWVELWLDSARVDLLAEPVQRDLGGYGRRLLCGLELARPDGRPARVELVFERMRPVELELDEASGPLPDEHTLYLLEAELCDDAGPGLPEESEARTLRNYGHELEFDVRGQAVLQALTPGRYRFLARPDDLLLDPPEILVEAQESLPVHLAWRPGPGFRAPDPEDLEDMDTDSR